MDEIVFNEGELIAFGAEYDKRLKMLEKRFLIDVSIDIKRALARDIMGLVEQPGTAPGSRRLQGVGAAFCLPL